MSITLRKSEHPKGCYDTKFSYQEKTLLPSRTEIGILVLMT